MFDVLLQVLDDGRLTDGQGRTVDFRNAILILTSNLGFARARRPDAARRGASSDAVLAVVREPLQAGVPQPARRHRGVRRADAPRSSTRIVDIQVARAGAPAGRPAADASRSPTRAREWLALNGFDPLYGARPLRRLVQTAIGDPLARALLAGEIRDGQTVTVDVRPDRSALDIASR